MAKPLSFKDMINVEYRPGEDELTNYRAYRRRRTCEDKVETDEALTIQQRMARGRLMKRIKSKIKIGRDRARRRMATKSTLERRAMKAARKVILKKLTKGQDKSSLPFARRQELEKRLDKPMIKKRIKMLAKRMFKDIRKKEIDRKKS